MFLAARRPLLIALLVAGAFFMENLDGTVIATAVPRMARSFGVSPVDLNIGITAYLLALAVFIPISGWLYGLDLIGRQEIHWLTTGLLLACSLTLGVGAVRHFRRHPHPLIDLSSLRVPTFA